jgi:hypothetical protein
MPRNFHLRRKRSPRAAEWLHPKAAPRVPGEEATEVREVREVWETTPAEKARTDQIAQIA